MLRQLCETSGSKAVAEAAQKVRAFSDNEQAETWRRLGATLMQIKS